MLDRVYHGQDQDSADSDDASRNAKRRKGNSGGDSESTSLFSFSSTKKTKGGIGYAGDQKEDVRFAFPFVAVLSISTLSFSILDR
mgnify:FL=1